LGLKFDHPANSITRVFSARGKSNEVCTKVVMNSFNAKSLIFD